MHCIELSTFPDSTITPSFLNHPPWPFPVEYLVFVSVAVAVIQLVTIGTRGRSVCYVSTHAQQMILVHLRHPACSTVTVIIIIITIIITSIISNLLSDSVHKFQSAMLSKQWIRVCDKYFNLNLINYQILVSQRLTFINRLLRVSTVLCSYHNVTWWIVIIMV